MILLPAVQRFRSCWLRSLVEAACGRSTDSAGALQSESNGRSKLFESVTMQELEVGRQAAEAAGTILNKYFRTGIEIREKGMCDLVSDADIESERVIVDVIRSTFPDHSILGEEGTQPKSLDGPLWVIDPLDGTTNFAHGIPHFATSIGFYVDGQPMSAIIRNPIRNDWFTAVRGEGSFWNGQRMQVSREAKLGETLIGLGFYYDRDALLNSTLASIHELFQHDIHGIRRNGSAALDLAAVGCGMFGAFFEYTLSFWDFAAGVLFVEEAGGKVTNCRGESLPMARSGILASNGILHQPVLDVVSKHHPNI